MKDRFGTVIYVGKARDLRKRVSQYFHPSRRMGWDLKFNALVEAIADFDFHVVRSDPEALSARRQAHQGISPALQRQLPRRQTVPDAQGESERPDPELHLHAAEEGRRRALFRAVCEFRRAPQHVGAGAATVQPARLPRVHPRRGGLQTLPLRAPEILHRAVRRQRHARAIPGTGQRRVRFSRRPVPRNAAANRSGNEKSRRRA